MFYVSSINGDKIGVTDTSDSVEEFYTDAQIAKFLKGKVVDIYGTSYYNYKANCTVLEINKVITSEKLKSLLADWRKVHNQWTGHQVEDYLASAKIGTKIIVEYVYTGDGDRKQHRGTTVIKKLSYDEWCYEDTDNTMSGKTGDSRFAAWCLEVACIYSKMTGITVL